MSRLEAQQQYSYALRQGQVYYRQAVQNGLSPYPPVLDQLLASRETEGQQKIGLVNIPADLIVGTRTEGRMNCFAGNFMPLLEDPSEFSAKWISLCYAHLDQSGIRDPVVCWEYLGRFYVEEGNKRVSVLKSFDAPTIPGIVTRILPVITDEPEMRAYEEFMHFYSLSGTYALQFRQPGCYVKLQAALGYAPDHLWTEEERRRFSSGFSYFTKAFDKINGQRLDISAAEALLRWLEVFSFEEIRDNTAPQLEKMLSSIWPDIRNLDGESPITISTAPKAKEPGILDKIISVAKSEHINAAFVYAFDPEKSAWTRAHVRGQEYLQEALGSKLQANAYWALDHDFDAALEAAAADKAQVIFATTPQMLGACRRLAALHRDIHILNCSLSVPYTGVRSYYSRVYESKFITGAIAGAMTEQDSIGYIADYPIVGVPAGINAFALGARLSNPRARVRVLWSCVDEAPLQTLIDDGITVISNRDAGSPQEAHRTLEWGTYKRAADGSFLPLAFPCWDWGRFYEKVILSIFNGTWDSVGTKDGSKPVNYWWGLSSGVIDVQLSEALPAGVLRLGELLKQGLVDGKLLPFQGRILDQSGIQRVSDGESLSVEEIMNMDWLCDAVDGSIPDYSELRPESQETVRILGLHREAIPPAREDARL